MTTTTIRPDTTTSGGSNYTATGAASLQAALNDDSDSSWIRKTGSGTSSTIIGFGTTAISGSQRVKQVRLRARSSTPTSSGKINYALGTRVSGLNYFFSALAIRGLKTTQEFVGAWQTTAPDGGSWDQARVDALRVEVTDYRDTSDRAYTYELYVDVDIANRPTVTVDAPTGTISTTAKPDISWTYSDLDGDGQAYYQIRIFTSAQYSTADFDPATSTSVWDSGQIASSDSSTVIDEYLANGTYRAYMRVAKLLGTEAYWSSYSYSQFTVSLTPPTTPTVTTTYSSVTNRVSIVVDGTAAVGFDYQTFEIERSIDAGTTWETVRGADAVIPGLGYDATVYDYEAKRGITVSYRARAIGYAGDNVIASAWSTTSTVSVTNDGSWWLKAISDPTINKGEVRVLAGIGMSIEEDLGVFRPIGRNRAVVVSGTIYGSDGDYTVATSNDAEWLGVYTLATHQGTLLVQAPDGSQKYVRVVTRRWTERGAVSALQREITLGYVEVE